MMRRNTALLAAVVFLLPLMSACEGPEGPAGPAGVEGPQGPVGPAGQDANQSCTQCHDDDPSLLARQLQWEASTHLTGGHFRYGSSSTTCGACHSHDGFLDRLATGSEESSQLFENPAPINCRTCHQIHTTYTSADFALTTSDPVTLWINDETVDVGDGNLCVNCHQPRVPDPMPVLGGDDVEITSTHWGVHYSPQGAIVAGTAGYEVPGTVAYPSALHAHGNVEVNADGCVTCHMAPPRGAVAGGHTLNMHYESRGTMREYDEGCETAGCHASMSGFDYNDVQTDVEALLVTLEAKLVAAGILDDGDPVEGTWAADPAGALLNYILIEADKTSGVHNPSYVEALLTNSIADDFPPSMSITAPAAGATLLPGTVYEITWSAMDAEGAVTVDLTYTADGLAGDQVIASDQAGSSFSWSVPATTLFNLVIKAVSTDGTGQTAEDTKAISMVSASPRGYVGSATCNNCHETAYDDVFDSGHPYKLNKVDGAAPTYPFSTVPNPPAAITWADVTYVIGGYGWKARFLDSDGYIYTAGGQNQYNLATLGWVDYHKDEALKVYDCGACHTTGWQTLAENGDVHQDGLPGISGTWEEPGVGCEACHGAGEDHITSLDAADITVDNSSAQCGTCHIRDDQATIPASGGFIKHHEQYNELLAGSHTGGVSDVGCNDCHDAHIGTRYGHAAAGGIVATCESCHAAQAATNAHISGPTCVTCHMAMATKSAVAVNSYTGDVRTHLFAINPDGTKVKADMFNEAGTFADKGWVTLDVACYSCHKDEAGVGGANSIKTMTELSAKATGIHN